jgi:hypothetical protein
MILAGWTPGNMVIMVIFSFISSVIWQLIKFPKPISFNILEVLFFIFFIPIVANRFDLLKTMQEGKWWWKSKSGEQK